MLDSWKGYKDRFFIGLSMHLCLIQPWQPQARTPCRAVCCWGRRRLRRRCLFSFHGQSLVHPPWLKRLPQREAERTAAIFLFALLWLSMASNSAVTRSGGISSCKVAAPCFKSPACCTIHHSFFVSTMTWELHEIRRSAIKIDQNALIDTENQSLKLRHHSSSFPSCLPTWWCAWLPLMSSDYWSLTFCTHISSFTWAAS